MALKKAVSITCSTFTNWFIVSQLIYFILLSDVFLKKIITDYNYCSYINGSLWYNVS